MILYKPVLISSWLMFAVYSSRIPSRLKMVIDHDAGADDAMAIFIALLREKYFNGPEVIGITTVKGNVNEPQAYKNTQRILDVARRQDVPIYRGCKEALVRGYAQDHYFGIDGLGDNEDVHYHTVRANLLPAVLALIEFSKVYKENLIVVTLAPLTNIALAIKLDPKFLSRIGHLYVGAGNVYDSKYTFPEFNTLLDVEAYYIVTEAATPEKVTVIPYSQILRYLNVTTDWRIHKLGAINTRIMKAQNNFENVSLPTDESWQLLDPAVMSIVLDNNVVTSSVQSNNSVILCGPERGITTNNFCSLNPNVVLVNSTSEDAYREFLLDTFSADLK